MIIYWSMMLWVPFIYLFYMARNREEATLVDYNLQKGIQNKIPLFFGILIFGYFIFWIGMRTYYADTSMYIVLFNDLPTNFTEGFGKIDWEAKGPFFDLYNLFFKCFISDDYHWWLMSIAMVSGFCVMDTLRKNSIDFFFSAFMFIATIEFTWMMNGMRQFVAVAIIFASTELLKKGKMWQYFIIAGLLYFVHVTAIVMIPIYFVAKAQTWSWKTMGFVLCIVFVVLFAEPLFQGSETIAGESYTGTTATDAYTQDDGVNVLRVAFYAIPTVLAFWRRKELEKYYEAFPILPICVNMSLATVAIYFVGMFTSGIFVGRVPIYCELYNLILVPFILKLGFDEKNKKLIKYVYVLVLVAYFYLQMDGQYYISDMTGMIR